MIKVVSTSDPFLNRFMFWARERFPTVNWFSAAIVYLTIKVIIGGVTLGKLIWSVTDISGVFFVGAHFLILRILDEHKDFHRDHINHTERPVQRGIIKLSELKSVGLAIWGLQILSFLSLTKGSKGEISSALLGVVVLYTWTLLMTFEFFIGEWLNKKIGLYSFLHLLVSPLLVWTVTLGLGLNTDEFVIKLMALALTTGFIYEITRKTKGKEEELLTEPSFSKNWGYQRSLITIALFCFVSIFLSINLLPNTVSLVGYTGLIYLIFSILQISTMVKFIQKPCLKNRKSLEGTGALLAATCFLIPIIIILLRLESQWKTW